MPGAPIRLPQRRPTTHKGDYGRVCVVAGSVGMTGAASLAAESALRAGAGLVTLACPAGTWQVLAAQTREVMVRPVGPDGTSGWCSRAAADVERIVAEMTGHGTVVAIGPGMGRSDEALSCARRLVTGLQMPMVVDADALVAFEGRPAEIARRTSPTILTPHPGEATRLVGSFDGGDDRQRKEAAERLAATSGAAVVLKGHRTVITDGTRTLVNATGNPGMATGGSGDVLTGVIAGLLAGGLAPFEAAALGAHLHGLAGDLAADELGQASLVAGDLVRSLPAAFRRHQS